MKSDIKIELCSVNGVKQTDHVDKLISMEELMSWEPGENIMITADTGRGKSYFIKKTFRDYLKANSMKCLYLVPRKSLFRQFQEDLPDDDTIYFSTYQSLETYMSIPNGAFRTAPVIVCDEAHYFLSDSTFNLRTDLSLDWVMGNKHAIKIFMTATPDSLIKFFIEEKISCRQYVFPFRSNTIKSLDFFYRETYVEELAEQISKSGSKAIFFLQKAERALALHQKFENCSMFVCSEHNKEYQQFLDTGLMEKLYTTKKFDCPLLLATSALDVGLTIKDKAITDIVVDMDDPATVIQCIGRKRSIDDSDHANVHILARNNNQLGGILTQLKKKDTTVKCFLEYGAEAYSLKHNRSNDNDALIVDVLVRDKDGYPLLVNGKTVFEKRVNIPKYAKIRYDIYMYESMIQGKHGYAKYVAEQLNVYQYSIQENAQKRQQVLSFLESLVGKPMLTVEEREPLIECLNFRRDNGELYTSFRKLSWYMEAREFPYRLKKYRTSRHIDGEKKAFRAWEVERSRD